MKPILLVSSKVKWDNQHTSLSSFSCFPLVIGCETSVFVFTDAHFPILFQLPEMLLSELEVGGKWIQCLFPRGSDDALSENNYFTYVSFKESVMLPWWVSLYLSTKCFVLFPGINISPMKEMIKALRTSHYKSCRFKNVIQNLMMSSGYKLFRNLFQESPRGRHRRKLCSYYC